MRAIASQLLRFFSCECLARVLLTTQRELSLAPNPCTRWGFYALPCPATLAAARTLHTHVRSAACSHLGSGRPWDAGEMRLERRKAFPPSHWLPISVKVTPGMLLHSGELGSESSSWFQLPVFPRTSFTAPPRGSQYQLPGASTQTQLFAVFPVLGS